MAALAGIDTASKSITLIPHYGNHRITTTSTSVSYAHAHQKDREGSRLSKLSNWNSTSQRGMRRASISWSGCWQLSKYHPRSAGSTNDRPTVLIHTGRKSYTSFDSCQVSSRERISRCYSAVHHQAPSPNITKCPSIAFQMDPKTFDGIASHAARSVHSSLLTPPRR